MIGKTIAHYRVNEKLGEGGMGEVYRAHDTRLNRDVALKILPEFLQEDDTARKRFLREALSAAAINHPYICKVYEVGEFENRSFIAIEYVQGQTLIEKLAESPLPLEESIKIGTEIAEALEEAHERGIIHRDLKPSNIMLTPKGHVQVLDFGLAKRVSGDGQEITTKVTWEGTTLGTLAYMSPEQIKGEVVDTRSDLFSFGIVLYEILTGVHPFRKAEPFQTLASILHQEPEDPSDRKDDLPESLSRLVKKLLAKDPVDRFQSATEVASILNDPSAPWKGRSRSLWNRWLVAALTVTFATVFALLGWWLLYQNSSGSSPVVSSLAVLPLENISGDPEQDLFVDGMTEALMTDLSKIGALKVIAHKSAMSYKGTQKPLAKIAQELNPSWVCFAFGRTV